MVFESGVYRLDIDVDRTRHFYQKSEDYYPCDCAGCRNFSKAHPFFSEAVQQFFEQLGINSGKPAEITAYNSYDGNMTYYDGFYHICGVILAGKEPWLQIDERAYRLKEEYTLKLSDDFSVFFTEKCGLVEEDFPTPVIQMEVQCNLPWVLNEPNPYHYK